MLKYIVAFLTFSTLGLLGQDLTQGLMVNDLTLRPMVDIAKPAYLQTITDPSFGTTIRRITNAGIGEVLVPMYSTIQAWNADESLMIIYNQAIGRHELLDGMNYQTIRELDDVKPIDLEQIFWDFHDPDVFYYPDRQSFDFIKYEVTTQTKQTLVNLATLSNCSGGLEMGNDIQMMSWDSDVFTFRCANDTAYSYRISSGVVNRFNINSLNNVAPGVAPSGNRFIHRQNVFDSTGNQTLVLNKNAVEHSCIGKLENGNDAYFAIAFQQGPQGGCIGDIIAHDLETGICFPVISQSQGYDYPQSGTHISALAHKNSESGWVAASMMGYDKDGQELLDQELVIAKAEQGNIKVCRIGHHRSDEDEYNYWGEPHAVLSPSGTRVLFASDWSGIEDGESIDCYVVELPAFSNPVSVRDLKMKNSYRVSPNPVRNNLTIRIENSHSEKMFIELYNSQGKKVSAHTISSNIFQTDVGNYNSGMYYFKIYDFNSVRTTGKFIKK